MRSLIARSFLTTVVLSFRPECCYATSKLVRRSFVPDTLAQLQHRQRMIAETSRAGVGQDSSLPSGLWGFESQTNREDSPQNWAVSAARNEQDQQPTLNLFPLSPETAPPARGSPGAPEQPSEARNNPVVVITEIPSKRPHVGSANQHPQHPGRINDGSPTAPLGLNLWPLQDKEMNVNGRNGVGNKVRLGMNPGSNQLSFHSSKLPQHPTILESAIHNNDEAIFRPSVVTSSYPMTASRRRMDHSHVPTHKQDSESSGVHAQSQGSRRTYGTRPKTLVTLNLWHSKNDEVALIGTSSQIHPGRPSDSYPRSTALPLQDERAHVNVEKLRTDKPAKRKVGQQGEERISKVSRKRPAQLVNAPSGSYDSGNLPDANSRVNMGDNQASIHAVSRTGDFQVVGPSQTQSVEQLLDSYPSLMLAWKPEIICKKASCAAGLLANDLLRAMNIGPSLDLLQKFQKSHGIIVPFTYNLLLKDLTEDQWESVKVVWREFWSLFDLTFEAPTEAHIDQKTEILRVYLWISDFISECTIPRILEKGGTAAKEAKESLATSGVQPSRSTICNGLSQLVKLLSIGHTGGYSFHKNDRMAKLNDLFGIIKKERSAYEPHILKESQYAHAFNWALLERLGNLCSKIQAPSLHLQLLDYVKGFDLTQIQRFEQVTKQFVFRHPHVTRKTMSEFWARIEETDWIPFQSQLSSPFDKTANVFTASLKNLAVSPVEILKHLTILIQYKQQVQTLSYLPARIHNFLKEYPQNIPLSILQ